MKNITIAEILDKSINRLKKYNIENPQLNAEQIISHVLGINKTDLYLNSKAVLNREKSDVIERLIIRRTKHEPLQYILGETEFYGCKIKVNPDVLIPRPETELLVEKVLWKNIRSILEIGTGSGAIAIALAKQMKNVQITATDISEKALNTARQNADLNNVSINFIQSDIFENIKSKFDIIISNPPYISQKEHDNLAPEIKDYEPEISLLAEDEGLFYFKKILENAKDYLTGKGKIYFEIGYDQAEKIKEIAKENCFDDINVFKDLNGFDRIMMIN
ncbi:MAG: peptide chain release factor N(5)-glutamine methyltransferase [Armatimonadetes bacterium]|nr:peptide chain release factor N(5)-glutamine methyltransferase [Armatimonadota bacterium]